MEKQDINELLELVDFEKNKYVKINDHLMLTNYQIEILKRFDINPENMNSLSEILMIGEEAYEDTLDEELGLVLDELSERNYYENTNK